MSSEVKRYDAVHLRYEDNNIRYGEGCEVEVVTARDYDALEAKYERLCNKWTDAEPAGADVRGRIVAAYGAGKWLAEFDALVAERDALHAEVEALRVALLEIASANPAERGIERAKSYASDGLKGAGSELYARWLDTLKEAEALRAENAALRAKQGERQEAVVYAVHAKGAQVDHHCPLVSPDMAADYLPGCATPLYTTPQPAPAQDVAGMKAVMTGLIDLAHEYRHTLARQNFPDNDEGDAFARHRDSQVARIDRILSAAHDKQSGEVKP